MAWRRRPSSSACQWARACWCWRTTTRRRCWNGRLALAPGGSPLRPCGGPMTAIGPRPSLPRSKNPARLPSALPPWADGGMIDTDRVAAALRRQGAVLLIDATHAVGVMQIDVRSLDPDFLVFPTYKWLLGPYGRAFLYVAKRHQDGVPLEQTSYGRRAINSERETYYRDTESPFSNGCAC